MPRKAAPKSSKAKTSAASRKKARSQSVESEAKSESVGSSPAFSRSTSPKAARAKLEDGVTIDDLAQTADTIVADVVEVAASAAVTPPVEGVRPPSPLSSQGDDDVVAGEGDAPPPPAPEEATVTEVAAPAATAVPPQSTSASLPHSAAATRNEKFIPLAALEAHDVDRNSEANHGLLREPGPPAKEIKRVTQTGESSPPLPTELMQLLSG